MTKIRGFVLREFKDAGTEQTFTPSNKPQSFESGAFANYKAAGLVSAIAQRTVPTA